MNLMRVATTDIGVDGRNEVTAAIEREHIQTGPERLFLYVRKPLSGNPWTVNQWTGQYLGLAWVGRKVRSGFGHGTYRRAITTRIFGVLYHGWYYESSGDYCRLKRAKNQNARYAASRG